MKSVYHVICLIVLSLTFVLPIYAESLDDTYEQVESLNLSRGGYTLGKMLNQDQKQVLLSHKIESTTPGTNKFIDNGLVVVTDSNDDRVLILYELFEEAGRDKVQDLTGMLFMDFDEPTVSAHDKLIYWAYGIKGKIAAGEYNQSKKDGKKLNVIATVKLNSDIKIMDNTDTVATGSVYYIISSDPLLKFYQ